MLQSADIKASRINPTLARNFAKAKGLLAKTDSINARILTDYGIQFSPRETAPLDPILEEIQSLVKYRRHLNDELHRERMHLEHMLPKSIESMVNSRIKSLQKQIEKVTAMMIHLKVKSVSLDQAVELLTTTKGVGDNSALSLLVAMPELGRISTKEAASRRQHRSPGSPPSIPIAERCEGKERSTEVAERFAGHSTWPL